MRRDGLRLSGRLRSAFYGAFSLLFLTGLAWWVFPEVGSALWPASDLSAVQPWLMKVHGGAAMLGLILLGVIYSVHITRGWRAGQNRASGLALVSLLLVLIGTGYLLYYAGGESFRSRVSWLHLWLGLGLPAMVVLHVARGRVLRRRTCPGKQN